MRPHTSTNRNRNIPFRGRLNGYNQILVESEHPHKIYSCCKGRANSALWRFFLHVPGNTVCQSRSNGHQEALEVPGFSAHGLLEGVCFFATQMTAVHRAAPSRTIMIKAAAARQLTSQLPVDAARRTSPVTINGVVSSLGLRLRVLRCDWVSGFVPAALVHRRGAVTAFVTNTISFHPRATSGSQCICRSGLQRKARSTRRVTSTRCLRQAEAEAACLPTGATGSPASVSPLSSATDSERGSPPGCLPSPNQLWLSLQQWVDGDWAGGGAVEVADGGEERGGR